jgi:hypothetical protein
MNTVPSTNRFPAAVGNLCPDLGQYDSESSESKIHITQGDTGNFDLLLKCGNC